VSNSSDLYHMMGLRGIDARRVRSNSVHDMLAVVGVEAARMTAINEYTDVMADDGYVNRAHFTLRADVQTRNGGFTPLSAAGLRATPHDVQQSASHRETAKMFVNASLEHRVNAPLISPSATVSTANQLARIGTGAVHLVPDVGALMHNDSMPQAELANVIAGLFCSSSAPRQMDGELAELLALAARTPAYSFTSPARGNDDDDETDWRSMAASGAMFSPVRELGIDELGTHIIDTQLPEPTFVGDDEDSGVPASQALGDESIDLESPTHNMLYQIQEAATATKPTTPVDSALRASSDEQSDENKPAVHDKDEDVDDKLPQRGVPGYSPTSPAMDVDNDADAASPRYTPTSPAYTPTSPSKATADGADEQDQGYHPDRPGYDNTPAPMRSADLDAILKALTASANVGNSFMVTHTNKVRMF
jgi:DNA-directed RNA polymerase II subunit RPB1